MLVPENRRTFVYCVIRVIFCLLEHTSDIDLQLNLNS